MPNAIRIPIVGRARKLAAAGVVLGLVAGFALARLMASLLFGVKLWDPAAFLAAPVILTGVALMAVWLPAMRAANVDPMQALRTEWHRMIKLVRNSRVTR